MTYTISSYESEETLCEYLFNRLSLQQISLWEKIKFQLPEVKIYTRNGINVLIRHPLRGNF